MRLAAILLVCALVALSACGGRTAVKETTPSQQQAAPTTGESQPAPSTAPSAPTAAGASASGTVSDTDIDALSNQLDQTNVDAVSTSDLDSVDQSLADLDALDI